MIKPIDHHSVYSPISQAPDSLFDNANWHYKLRQQRRIISVFLVFIAIYCCVLSISAIYQSRHIESVGLIMLSVVNITLAIWHARFASDYCVSLLTGIGLIVLYFYLLIRGADQGGNVLWALTLAPAYFFLLGHRLGLLFFSISFFISLSLFFTSYMGADIILSIPKKEDLFEAKVRFLSIYTLLAIYSFLLEYDRARVVGTLLGSREAMRLLASTDELTGLANRRTMGECLSLQEHRSRVHHEGYGLILCDIDHFKKINDSYGHQCGDLVITHVAIALQSALREHDVVARWGGEEFLVVLPDTDAEGAMQVAIKLRHAIATISIDYESSLIQPTLSFGVANGDHNDSIETYIKRADESLYKAKNNGRNCIVQF